MTLPATTQLLIIRHAPAITEGRMAGRRDVDADCSDLTGYDALRRAVGGYDHLVISPARRCAQTAAALWPYHATNRTDPALREQDFGDWEGVPYADLPDLGAMSGGDLAAFRPPNGESFADICARMIPALVKAAALGGRVVIVAHAGTVRAALAHATGSVPAGLAFQVAPSSLTRFVVATPDGPWSVGSVNQVFG